MTARLVCAVFLALLLAAAGAQAQTVTKKTYLTLNKVQELIDAERYGEAITELTELTGGMKNRGYDFALASRYLAHTYVLSDQQGKARPVLEAALGATELPDDLKRELKLFYGQILMGQEEFELALPQLEEWYAMSVLQTADQVFIVGFANYQTGNRARAEELIDKAIGMAEKPRDSWYQLYYQILFEQKKYRRAEETAMLLIELAPDKPTHWRILANHYLQLERDNDALAVLMVAYQQSLLSDDDDLKRLSVLHSFIGVPEKAARLMTEWIEADRLPSDAETLLQIGNLWLVARERDRAKEALLKAAALSPDGKVFESLGRVYFEDDEWQDAYSAFQDALKRGGVENPDEVHLLAGISAYRADMAPEARLALTQAAKSAKYRGQARDLLSKLDES